MPASSRTAHWQRLSTHLVARPVWTLLPVLTLCTWAALHIPALQNDPAPERLVAADPVLQANAKALTQSFEVPGPALLLLVHSRQLLTDDNLAYLHALTQRMQAWPWIDQVQSITTTPLARRESAASTGAPADSLEALEAELNAEADDSGALALNAGQSAALAAFAETHPRRFPAGIDTLLEELTERPLKTTPAAHATDKLTPQAAAALRHRLTHSDQLDGRLIDRAHHTALIVAPLKGGDASAANLQAHMPQIEALLRHQPPPAGVQVTPAGLPYLRAAMVQYMRADRQLLIPLTLLLCTALLWWSFRWWPAVVLPLVVVGLSTLAWVGGMAWVQEPMNVLSNVIPPLLIIIGISDSIHLIARYREALGRGRGQQDAAAEALRTMAAACLLTSLFAVSWAEPPT
ncbi:MAG: MMPL family transporter, partial [Polyangiales bacterium]